MSQSRQINIRVNLDTSQVPKQAQQSTKAIRAELEKQKAAVDKIMSDLLTSGGKLKVPMEDFKAAATAAGAALDRIGERNASALERLYPKYEQLKAKIREAYQAGDMQQVIRLQNGPEQAMNAEIESRKRLEKEIRTQWNALDQLNSKVEQSANANKKQEQSAQTLSQQLSELKRRMSELAAAGQQDSKEYQECSLKAKELSKSLQQLNADAKPDAHVRLRTALMNAKQAMVEAADKFGRGSVQFQQARDEAIRLQQAMNGMNKQIRNLAAPNATYQGIINGLSGISGAASAVTGTMALFGGESEQTAKAMAKLQAIMSITMGLQSMSMMLNQNSAVQLNIIGKLTEWWATCKAKAAAATAAETGAVVANTTAQTVQTTAVTAGTTANVVHAASWKAIGIAIKSVPVFGWIVAGIGALIAVIAAFNKKTNEEVEAQKRLQQQQEEHRRSMASYRSSFAQTAANLLRGYKDLQIAWKKLRTEHEKRKWLNENTNKFNSLGKSVKTVGDAENFLVANTDNVVNALKARAMALAAQEMQNEAYKKYLERMFEIENTVAGGGYYSKYNGNKTLIARNPDLPQSPITGRKDGALWHEAGLTADKDYTVERTPIYDKDENDITYQLTLTESGMAKLNKLMREKAIQRKKTNQDKATTEWQRVEQWTEEEIKKQQKIIGNAGMNFDESADSVDSGGGNRTHTDLLADAQKAFMARQTLLAQQARDRARAAKEAQFAEDQAAIDAMAEGQEKRDKQRRLNAQKDEYALQTEMEDKILAEINAQKAAFDAREEAEAKRQAAAGKTYTKQVFDPGELIETVKKDGSSLYKAGQTIGKDAKTGNVETAEINAIAARYGILYHLLTQKHAKSLADQQKADQLAMNEYLQQYGTYEEKKTAIAAIYAAKRAKATTDAEQMQLAQEENKALNDVEFDDFMTNRAALAFGEIDNLSRSTIARLITEMEQYRDKITQTFDPDKIEKFNRALADLKRAQAMSDGGLFSQLFTPAFFKERKAAITEINAAEQTHNDLLKAKSKKEEEVEEKIRAVIAKVKELTGQDLTPDKVKDGSTVSDIIGQQTAAGNNQGATDLSNLMSGLNGARTELGQVTTASNKAGASLKQLKEAFVAKFTGEKGFLGSIGSSLEGLIGLVGGVNEAVNQLMAAAEALGADTSEGSAWWKAQQYISTLTSSMQAASSMVKAALNGDIGGILSGAIGVFTGFITGFSAIHDASRERTIQRLQDEIDDLERRNRRIEHNLEKQYSKQASQSYEDEVKNLEKQRRLIQEQIAAEEDKKNTDDDRIQEWKDQYEELKWKIEEYKDKAIDAILGEDINTSIDDFTNALAESWGKTGERARAAKDYIKSILRQMVLEAMKTDLTKPIEQLRKKMSDALDDNVVTEQEQAELEAFAKQLADETESKYKWADRIMNGGASGSGGGTTGTFATASQDSVAELSGRAAAIHTSGEMRRELLLSIGIDVAELKAQAAASAANSAEMRELQLIAVGHLETIARNTNELYEMNARLDKIERNTRGL